MRLQSKKLIAVLCALAMIISVFPVQADAAAKPKFVKNYTVLYENSTGKKDICKQSDNPHPGKGSRKE